MRLVEAGLSTLAQDYVRVLAEYVMGSVTGATLVEQDTVPEWVQYTAYLAKYLVSDYMSYIHDYTVYLCRTRYSSSSKVVMVFISNHDDMIISHQSFLTSCLISQLLSYQKLQLSPHHHSRNSSF